MTDTPDDALQASQHEVQRLLGLCLLRLQRYERLLKILLVQHEFSGSALDVEAVRAARLQSVSRNTLGMLVRDFLGSYLVAGDGNTAPDQELGNPESPPQISFKFQVESAAADYAQAESDIKELVRLRNMLVHHFIEQQDFDSLDGCRRAEEDLVAASAQIGQSYERLKDWVQDMHKMQERMQSDEVREAIIKGLMAASPGGERRH